MNLITALLSLPRNTKKTILLTHDFLIILFAFWFSIAIRWDFIHEVAKKEYWVLWAITTVVTITCFIRLGLYRAVIRFLGSKVLSTALVGSIISVLILILTAYFLRIDLPRTIPILYFLLLLILLTGSRLSIRAWLQGSDRRHAVPVIIYGAGDSGRQLQEALSQLNEYYPIAFVDDDPKLHRSVIRNIGVFSPQDLQKLIERHDVKKILLAMPSIRVERRKQIIRHLEIYACEVLTIPGMKDLLDGKVSVSSLKKVSVFDLLGRTPVEPMAELMAANIADKVVMVTGAGGSIGAELCRQIMQHRPKKLVMFELSEFNLYSIDKELNEYKQLHGLDIELLPLLGSVQDQARLQAVMQTYEVATIYHAAAYKHVPMVEFNVVEGIRNNVYGTLHCAQAAIAAGVQNFVLISTDKAVRPTNTMGASKRLAELVLQALAAMPNQATCFCMVRFGNVLGSSGSVVPVFEKQILAGGPVTLTHPEITRFFMTIPEAAQLVIQAGAMGKGGDVFVLDMGEPVKIIDLAQQMVHLSGLTLKNENNPKGDIEIKISGLRPGEKLYEELLVGEQVCGTSHSRIMTAQEIFLPWPQLETLLAALDEACNNNDQPTVRHLLLQAPAAFKPKDNICDLVWQQQKMASGQPLNE
ncbi:polysaccharide biosynthesis protein [Paralysiella testudinis]|uniref:Polysaccharide biosynthesis protein n=1 Tax=Paralysiella testudinis TaxID=2809020 RepID=A0A892ZG52_9NEIS|nr:nucleoside-diphosphate sugar epimerase/dehydratase [Paralysiella testudinis]QRQ82445.1 polysaccharide biosynthesis protein [Paralysiella testudinis]